MGKASKKGPPTSSADGGATATSGGCMSSVFHLFDFQFCLHHPPPSSSSIPLHSHHSTVLKGMEAPRNSLELESEDENEEVNVSVLPSSKQDEKLHIPMSMQIKTSCDKRRSTSVDLSEISSSPGLKTPTLVARLMGLDLVPDSCSSPSSSSTISSIHATPAGKKSHLHRLRQGSVPGTRSLPDTPRVSSSSSRRSVDADHRLSLQINKENLAEALEFSSRRRGEMKWQDENRSPSEYARQILKQVKESVSKRVGLADVTNSSVWRNQEQRRDQELLIKHLKSKKSSKGGARPDDQLSPPKNSPRLRLFESKNKPRSSTTALLPSKPLFSLSSSSSQLKQGKKVSSGTGLIKKPPQTSDIMRKNKQEEPFVRPSSTAIKKATGNIIPDHNKCKKTPLMSRDLLSPALIPAKKDHSSPVTKIVLLQSQVPKGARESRGRSQLSSSLSHDEYKEGHTARDKCSSKHNGGGATTGDGGAEYEYVTRILNCTGIHKDKSVPFTTWFSPSHPLNPSLFHQLELSPESTTTVSHRKLLFHLVDEMLVQILRPHVNMKPWCTSNISTVAQHFGHMRGSELVDTLCTKIRSFPAKDCLVLEDIDEIIEGDLSEWKIRDVGRLELEEEGERIVGEIEKEVVDTLVHETAAMVASWGRFGGEGCWRPNGGVWG